MTCTYETDGATDLSSRTFTSISLPSRLTVAAAPAAAVAAAEPDLIETHHVSAFGDLLISSQHPRSGTVDIKGNLGFIEVDLTIGIVVANSVILTIEVREPIKLGPAQWTFDISGSTLTRRTAPSTAALMAASPDWSCILRCGSDKILPILMSCLPTLVSGPQAFVSCAIGQLAGNSSDIARCIVTTCL